MGNYAWYIVQAHSGFEKKVAQSILDEAERRSMSDYFERIEVPTEDVMELKKGRKVNTERKFFPGYVMVRMVMDKKSYLLVKGINKVTGFLGGGSQPQPIPDREAESIFRRVEEGLEKPRHIVSFEVGDSVKIIDGPFESFVGVVEEVDEERAKLKVSVSIFGRTTPVELEFSQVENV